MEFGQPPRNEEVAGFPQRLPAPLRARGNLTYPEFIRVVKTLWEEAHPDIPIRPVQSDKYSTYPVITYGLEMRKTLQNEPKMKHRETVYQQDGNLRILGQRFQNLINFTVITENKPELCEAIIETFEDFMLEYTPVFKELGASEFMYARRVPDREQTRPDEDTEERGVTYLVTLEKIVVQQVEVLREIYVKARTMLQNYWQGMEFWVFDPDDENSTSLTELFAPGHPFEVGDLVVLHIASEFQDMQANGKAEFTIPRKLPDGLFQDYLYQVAAKTEGSLVLADLQGNIVTIRSSGMGRLSGAADTSAYVKAEYIDEFQTATPSY